MPEDHETRDRARERMEYRLTPEQYERWRELLRLPTTQWPKVLQRLVFAAVEREGQRRDVVLCAVADYIRRAVPTPKEPR